MTTSLINNMTTDLTGNAARALAASQLSKLGQEPSQEDSRDFGSILFSHSQNNDKKTTPEKVRQAAEQLVSGTLVLPILTQLRAESSKDKLFSGGQTAQAFGQQLDTMLADRIVHRSNFAVVDQVANRFLKQKTSTFSAVKPATQTTGGIDQHG